MKFKLIVSVPTKEVVLETEDEYTLKNWIKEYTYSGYHKFKVETED